MALDRARRNNAESLEREPLVANGPRRADCWGKAPRVIEAKGVHAVLVEVVLVSRKLGHRPGAAR